MPTSTTPQFRLGLAFGIGSAIMLALNNTGQAIFYDAGGSAQAMLVGRSVAFCGVGLVLWQLFARSPVPTAHEWPRLLFSATTFTVGTIALLLAMQHVPVSLAILLLYTFPLFTILFQSVLDRRWPGLLVLLAAALTFVGLCVTLQVPIPLSDELVALMTNTTGFSTAWLNLPGASSPTLSADSRYDGVGIALAVFAGFAYAVTFEWNVRTLSDTEPVFATTWMNIIGAPLVALFAFSDLDALRVPADFSTQAIGILAILCLVVGMFMVFIGMAKAGSLPTGLVMNVEPVATLALAALVLTTVVSPMQMVGSTIVIVGIVLAQWANQAAPTPRATA